jgi:hypothetical protein
MSRMHTHTCTLYSYCYLNFTYAYTYLYFIFLWIVEVKVTLQPTVSQPVSLGVRRPSGTRDQFFFLLEIPFRHLPFCNFVAPFLTRGRVCNLLYNCFWTLPEQSLLGRSPVELTAIFYSPSWDSPNLEGQVPVFISPRNRVAQLYPRALGSIFVASYDSQGYGGGILTRLHTGYVWILECHVCIHVLIIYILTNIRTSRMHRSICYTSVLS